MTAAKRPLSSFGPEIMNALIKGASEPVRIPFSNGKLAIRFQQRVHQLRVAMAAENHPDTEAAYRAGTRLEGTLQPWAVGKTVSAKTIDVNFPAFVVIEPKDAEFTSALQQAGVSIDPGEVHVDASPSEEKSHSPSLDEILGRLK